MFSPYYAWSGWRDPLHHCAVNVALYRLDRGGGAWAMTERGRARVRRSAGSLEIGPSALHWENGALTARIDEITAPIPGRLRGSVRLVPEVTTTQTFVLNSDGRHVWAPLAPRVRVEVEFAAPALRWAGVGYLDHNRGAAPLADGFRDWTWARAHLTDDVAIFYDANRRDGSREQLALRVTPAGAIDSLPPSPMAPLPDTGWGLKRATWPDGDDVPRVRRTLEDTPFYARTALEGRCLGERATIMHESLSLDRLRTPVVRAMLPFRMPRFV